MDKDVLEGKKEVLDQFYVPKFSEYDFICLFIGLLKLADIQSFEADEIEQYIINGKTNKIFTGLLREFKIKSNGYFEYSEQFQDSIRIAKLSQLLHSISPETNSTLYIGEVDIMELIKGREEYIDLMKVFINEIYDLNYESEFQEFTNYKKETNSKKL